MIEKDFFKLTIGKVIYRDGIPVKITSLSMSKYDEKYITFETSSVVKEFKKCMHVLSFEGSTSPKSKALKN